MEPLPEPVARYLAAYNAKDVGKMLDCLAEDVTFQNLSGEEVTASAEGKAAFAELAAFGAKAFEERRQTVTNAITVADLTLVEVDYAATVAMDLPNGWTAGQKLAFKGASSFRLADGKIANLVDQSA